VPPDNPPAWWGALAVNGLDYLSAPELQWAIRELTQDRGAFLGVLTAAARYPRESMVGPRRPDPAEVDGLDRTLPPSRALVHPEDEAAVLAAGGLFQTVLALDPFWAAPRLLYSCWHARSGISLEQADALLEMAGPCVRLAPLIADGSLRFVPDHLPGSWEPYPMPRRAPPTASPQVRAGLALRRAARLVYWADRLGAVVVAAQPETAAMLHELVGSGLPGAVAATLPLAPNDDLAAALRRRAGAGVRDAWSAWPALDRDRSGDLAALVACLTLVDSTGEGPRTPWSLACGPPRLPDVALAIRRVQSGRPVRDGHPGVPVTLRRPVLLLTPAGQQW